MDLKGLEILVVHIYGRKVKTTESAINSKDKIINESLT